MLTKPPSKISKTDLDALVTEKRPEVRTLDYKRDLELSTDDHKRELARDVSSFANAAGGDIVFGIEEAKDATGKNLGYPERIIGVPCENLDATKLRIESILSDNVDPRVPGIELHAVDGFERGPAIIMRVPRSWIGPHMVSFRNQTHFFSRNSAGKQPLDVRQIRAAFLESNDAIQRVQRFRDERIARVVADDTPVPIWEDERLRVIVHAVPIAPGEVTLDVRALAKKSRALMAPLYDQGSLRFNFDGLLAYAGPQNGAQFAYSQAFRDGSFEGVFTAHVNEKKAPPELFAFFIEQFAASTASAYLRELRAAEFAGPVAVLVALLGVKGTRIYSSELDRPWNKEKTIDRDILTLPEVLVEGSPTTDEFFRLLQTPFDILWQASGWDRSYGYDEKGAWIAQRHAH